MKALSIRQPWAWLIAQGLKDIENRTWRTQFRGPVLIHASATMTRNEYEDVVLFLRWIDAANINLPKPHNLERGGIVGVANLVECVSPDSRTSAWHMGGQFGFRFEGAQPLPFTPLKGALQFFDAPFVSVEQLRAGAEQA